MSNSRSHKPLLQVTGIGKSYPGVQALKAVDFEVFEGEVHALVGENGAGKSTLCKVIGGVIQPDEGGMTFSSTEHKPSNWEEAEQAGIRMVMQELNLIPTLTVAENIFIDKMPSRLGWLNRSELNRAASKTLAKLGLHSISPDTRVGELGIGQQQMVEIAGGLSRDCKLLVLDEPTAALSDSETEHLFKQIRRLKKQGVGVIYISHRLNEIMEVADRITVLRDGQFVASTEASSADIDRIIKWMVGRDVSVEDVFEKHSVSSPILQVKHLNQGTLVRDVSFELRRGEILGFAGLMGSGRTETLRTIFGADLPDSGEILLGGKSTSIRSPREAVRQGLALLTEDRKTQGLFLPLSVRENVTANNLNSLSIFNTWVLPEEESCEVVRLSDTLNIRASTIEQPVVELSGGNQQKVLIARWLLKDSDILMFDEPTRGIDVGARFEIYKLLNNLKAQGKGIIMASSDLVEIMAVCERVAVMSSGKLVRIFNRGEWDQDAMMAAALSEHVDATGEKISA